MIRMLAPLTAGLAAGLIALGAHAQQAPPDPFPLPPKQWPSPVMDTSLIPFLLVDRLEYRWQSDDSRRVWDLQGWVGGDIHKLWLKSEGEEVAGGRTEEANIEVLYARLISPYWHLQIGMREAWRPSPSRTALALGLQGLAPYWFELDATAYLDEEGDVSARIEAEYDLRLTQRLILQPRLETQLAAASDRARGIGRGVNEVELGLRLRYEIHRQFAPYVGIAWSRSFGKTADFARDEGADVVQRAIVAGLRVWF